MKLHLPLSILKLLVMVTTVLSGVAFADREIALENNDEITITPGEQYFTSTDGNLTISGNDFKMAIKGSGSETGDYTDCSLIQLKQGNGITVSGTSEFKIENVVTNQTKTGAKQFSVISAGFVMNDGSKSSDVLFEDNDTIVFNSNKYNYNGQHSASVAYAQGGVISIDADMYLKMRNNGDIVFSDNCIQSASDSVKTDGGAIYLRNNTGTANENINIVIDSNKSVTFSDNKVSSLLKCYSAADNNTASTGGAISSDRSISISQNIGSVTFSGNEVENHYESKGGAIYTSTHRKVGVTLNENAGVVFENNAAHVACDNRLSTAGHADGGAIYSSVVAISGNTSTQAQDGLPYAVLFKGNSAKSDYISWGGAIYAKGGSGITIQDNKGTVAFLNNLAFSSSTSESNSMGSHAAGGAMYCEGDSALDVSSGVRIENNGDVIISGNSVTSANSKDSAAVGGAIYTGQTGTDGLSIRNNGNVTFSGNYEKKGSTYRLRSVYVSHGDINLSAAEGKTVTFYDTIEAHAGAKKSGNLNLNEDYNGQDQSGKIVFSGKYTQAHLSEIAGTEITDADVIAASRTSVVEGTVTLHAGTLSLQDDAVLQATEVIIAEGAALEAVRTDDVAAVVFSLGAEEAALLSPAATLAADLVLAEGAMVNLDGGNIDLGNNALTIGDKLIVTLSGDLLGAEELVLFTNVTELEGDVSEVVVNGVTTTGSFSNGDVIINIANVPNIPEPATAALSLLALAGLAARRRRK